jgi:hypothetical protein
MELRESLLLFFVKLRALGTWENVPNKSAEDWIVDGFRSICEDLCSSLCMSLMSIRWYFYRCFFRICTGQWCRTGTWVRADQGDRYPLVNIQKTMENHLFFMGKSTISMVIFNSYICHKLPEGTDPYRQDLLNKLHKHVCP